jgi:hypothetical protein
MDEQVDAVFWMVGLVLRLTCVDSTLKLFYDKSRPSGPTCSEWTVSLLLRGKDREMVVIGVGVVAGAEVMLVKERGMME